jgi:outer membrane protein TolC
MAYLFNPLEPVRVTSDQVSDLLGTPAQGDAETITVFEGQEDTQYQFQATVEQPVYTWGKIRTGIDLAEVGVTAASLRVEGSELQLRTQVQSLYYSLHYLSKVREELRRQEEAAQQLVEISRRSFESGVIVRADLLQARVQAQEASLAVTEVESQIDRNLAQLAAATGLGIDTISALDFSQVEDLSRSVQIAPAAVLVERATAGSTELALLESQVDAAELQRRLAEAGGLLRPDIGLNLQLQFAGPRFPFIERDWYRQDQPNNTISIGLETTIFDAGRTAAEISTEEIDVGAARLDRAEARAEIERTVRETRAKVTLDRARVEQALLQEENAEVQLDLRKREWDNGTGTESDYLRQLIDTHAARARKHQRILEFHLDYFQLLAATGRAPGIPPSPAGGGPES